MTAGVLGRRYQGKSTFAVYLTRTAKKRVFYDPRNQFPEGPDGAIIDDPMLLLDTLEEFDCVVVRPPVSMNLQAATSALADAIAVWIRRHPDQDLAVILDEAGTYKEALKRDNWNWLFRTIDRDRVWIVMTAHRPVDIDPTVRALLDWIVVFRTTHQADLDALEDRCGTAFAEQARHLPERVALLWDDTQVNETKQVRVFKDPKAWYVRLGPAGVMGPSSVDRALPDQ